MLTFPRTLVAELRKTATLPGSLAALAVASVGPLGISLLNSMGVRNALRSGQPDLVAYTSAADAVFSAAPLGTVGAVVLGVIAVSSEYTANTPDAGGGRQITATLTATPSRLAVVAAKATVVALLVLATAAVTIPVCLGAANLVLGGLGTPADVGDTVARGVGAAVYWTLTALMVLAITVLTRNGIGPLIAGIVNSSLVSVSVLLSHVTPLAYYLPDLAGMRLFADDSIATFDGALDPIPGGLVMATWALGLLAISSVVFTRRDA
ncbi:hypothetical protein GCM10010172_50750 [Paractinoplanes ferrugineus]|uniref:ABC transporter permease n=1 Tax=Paractinoplanes ferrugineus TaxID=113564 RepID=A0A919JA50_9ACTN|nr:hypothetical protein [Actinoplanes ferrugineus]GIE16107.1 hypothetical protein Afe05nite_79470 [Actinoplanes ferrugineus]